MTPEREQRMKDVQANRQSGLAVVIDNVFDPHNVAAILRSCDAFGVTEVHLYYSFNKMPTSQDLRSKAASSAAKWLTIKKWPKAEALAAHLRVQGMRLLVADVAKEATLAAQADLASPVAIVFGSETSGASEEMKRLASGQVRIPMIGMVESFNVSVAAGILLYEAYRQREVKGLYR